MKVLCKNTWKKRIGSILLCCCILITNVQIPAYVSAEESETVQALEDTEVDEGIQKLEEEISTSEAPSLDLSVPETSAPETTVSQPETSAPAETQLPDLTVSELETQSPTASETELQNPAETQPIPETPIIDATERMTEGSLEETECETEKVIEVTEAETEESETESETEDRAAQWDVQNGAYVITSLEELQWYGQNGAGKNAYLANDLRIENGSGADTAWQPIEISGNAVFDGKDHTIEFYLTSCNAETNTEQVGLFAADNCTIQNLILKGSVICNVCKGDEESGYGYVGAVSGTGFGVTFRNILSYINVINQSTAPTGGMIGYLGQQGSGKTVIDNCAVYADVCGKDAAGGLAGSDSGENWSWKMSNSSFYGNVSGAEGKTGALIGSHETEDWDGMEIGNCYYLENLQSIGVAENQEAIDGSAENSIAQNSAKSAEQFASGEITSLLNGGITDGSQRWYQTCGMGLPVFEGETVYAHLVGEQTVYTNSATPIENETEATENESEETQTEAATENETEKMTAESVKAMIDALPETSELETLDEETLDQVYRDAQKAWDAYENLTEEQQALLSEEKQKLDGVLEYFNDPIPTTISDSNGPGYGDYGYVFTGYFSAGYNLWITAGTNGGTAIYYREGNTATGTIKYLNASGAAGDDLSEVSVAGAAGGSSTNLSYNIYMDGGKIKNIYCSASANQGTVNVIITGGIVTNSICTLAMNTGINKNGNRHVFSTVDVPISTYSTSFQGYLKKSGSQWIGYNNPVIPSGYTMELNAGDTLTVPDGKTLTNNGTIKNHGATISGDWTFVNNGTVTCSPHSYRSSGTPCSNGDDTHSYPCYFHSDVLDTAHNDACDFDEYGFCTVCDGYETPSYDWYLFAYQIKLPGHMFWLADKINTGGEINTQDAVLYDDIDLNADGKNRTWIPIGKESSKSFSGTFDGNGHTISNLKQDVTPNGRYGLFGYVSGGTVEDFSINGEVTMNCTTKDMGYGVIGEMTSASHANKIHSSVNVNVLDSGMKRYVGGIVGVLGNDCYVDQCYFSGTLDFKSGYADCCGGIVGYIGYQKTAYIRNCLFDGTITSDHSNPGQIGGIFGYYNGISDNAEAAELRVQNCLSVGNIDLTNTTSVGAIGGRYRVNGNTTPVTKRYCYNNHYNCGSLPAFAEDINKVSGYSDSVARQATTKELAHGGICWLLNGKTSNSSNVWKQTIGTNTYPGFSGNIVYGIEGEDAVYGRNDTQTIKQVNGYYEINTPIQLVIFQELVDVGNRSAKGS